MPCEGAPLHSSLTKVTGHSCAFRKTAYRVTGIDPVAFANFRGDGAAIMSKMIYRDFDKSNRNGLLATSYQETTMGNGAAPIRVRDLSLFARKFQH